MTKKKIVKKVKIEEDVEEIIEQEITYICPIKGKVTQKVKIKKIKPKPTFTSISVVESGGDVLSKLDKEDEIIEDLELDDE